MNDNTPPESPELAKLRNAASALFGDLVTIVVGTSDLNMRTGAAALAPIEAIDTSPERVQKARGSVQVPDEQRFANQEALTICVVKERDEMLARIAQLESVVHCMCQACKDGVLHDSDCSVHNMPAYPNEPCDCSIAPVQVCVERGRVWIKRGTQSFMLAYEDDENTEWYANQLRKALSIITPDIKNDTEALRKELERVRGERDAMALNEQRYQWLRAVGGRCWTVLETQTLAKDEWFDAVVDAAIAAQGEDHE